MATNARRLWIIKVLLVGVMGACVDPGAAAPGADDDTPATPRGAQPQGQAGGGAPASRSNGSHSVETEDEQATCVPVELSRGLDPETGHGFARVVLDEAGVATVGWRAIGKRIWATRVPSDGQTGPAHAIDPGALASTGGSAYQLDNGEQFRFALLDDGSLVMGHGWFSLELGRQAFATRYHGDSGRWGESVHVQDGGFITLSRSGEDLLMSSEDGLVSRYDVEQDRWDGATSRGMDDAFKTHVTGNARGDALVVTTDLHELWASVRDADTGEWMPASPLDTIELLHGMYFEPYLAADGTALLYYRTPVRPPPGRWQADTFVLRRAPQATSWEQLESPGLIWESEVVADGHMIVLLGNAGREVSARVLEPGESNWQPPQLLSDAELDITTVELATTPDGAIAVWRQRQSGRPEDDDLHELVAATLDLRSNTWSAPQRLKAHLPVRPLSLHLATGGGSAMLVWHQHDGERATVWGCRWPLVR